MQFLSNLRIGPRLGLAFAMMAGYASMLGSGYQHHFKILSAIGSVWNSGLAGSIGMARDGHPLYWYLGMMWADFFPWCALLPSALLLLWAQRPFRAHPTELLLLVWVLSLFTAFSLATLKREPYLMTIVPGIGLMIGYFYHRMFETTDASRAMTPLLKVLLVVLALVFGAGMFFGAAPLRKRWLVSSPVVSPVFIMTIVALSGTLIYAVAKARLQLALLDQAQRALPAAPQLHHLGHAAPRRRHADRIRTDTAIPSAQSLRRLHTEQFVCLQLYLDPLG